MKRIALIIAAAILCVLLFWVFLFRNEKIDPSGYPFFLLARELAAYELKLDLSGGAEHAIKCTYYDGSSEFEYGYDTLKSQEFDQLFLSVRLEIERNKTEARTCYFQGLALLKATSIAIGQPCRAVPSPVAWGEKVYYAIRERDGAPTGFFFSAIKGNKVYTVLMSGLYSSDHSLITDLVWPKLQAIDAMDER